VWYYEYSTLAGGGDEPESRNQLGGRARYPGSRFNLTHGQDKGGLREILLVLTIACLGCLGGCASLNELRGASTSALVLEVPYERQRSEYLCGLAVADMLSRYHDVPLATAQREQLQIEANRNGGISGKALKSAFEASEYTAVVFAGSLDHELTGIYRHLDLGRPLIVMFTRKAGTPGHYAVVTGYDPMRDLLIVLDPEHGPRNMSRQRFQRQWEPSERFTLLAIPEPKANGGAVPKPK
jgi:hypothetical protein